jgi:mRNA-degrading endonuclease RelE of RelBE toxin-antitoxin system
MQTVAETPTFSRQADRLFSDDEKRELIDYLAENPLAGKEIRGTGGVRKIRFGALGRGKRGGARVVYFYGGDRLPIYALLAYSKSHKTDLSPMERRAVAALVEAIRRQEKEERS